VQKTTLKHAAKAKRRAREAIAAQAFDPMKVFARDGWRCRLCGAKTPRAFRGTYEPNAPELDHIVPLALGGSHTPGNCQLACRSCNGRKGATALGQVGFDFL
jgi:5-methylcytosine-specific restriction endonuclease McrA